MEKIKNYIYILPTVIFIGLFFLYGVIKGGLQSFGLYKIIGKSSFSLEFYKEILKDREFLDSLIFTSRIALVSSILALFLSILILYLLYINLTEGHIKKEFFQKIVETPLLVPYLIASYLILILFMQSGLISKLLLKINLIDDYRSFPILTNEKNGIGIIITYVWKTIPFVVMMAAPILERIRSKWESLRYMYNISKPQFFIGVILPLMGPSLLMSYFIILAYMFTSFEVPLILGVTYPKALAVQAYDIYARSDLERRGAVMAINMLISLISLLSGALVYTINKKLIGRNKGAWE